MSTTPIPVKTQPVPDSYCMTNLKNDWNFLVSLLSAQVPQALTSINFGNTTPSPDKQDRPWFRTNADGTPDKLYSYANGYWICRHPMAERVGQIIAVEIAAGSIDTYDGGEAGTVTKISGPMWEKVTEVEGRYMVGAGTTPNTGTVIGLGDQGGDERANIVLTKENMPALQFQFGVEKSDVEENDEDIQPEGKIRAGGGSDINYIQENVKQIKIGKTNQVGETKRIEKEILPPFYAVHFLRKTAREYYRV